MGYGKDPNYTGRRMNSQEFKIQILNNCREAIHSFWVPVDLID